MSQTRSLYMALVRCTANIFVSTLTRWVRRGFMGFNRYASELLRNSKLVHNLKFCVRQRQSWPTQPFTDRNLFSFKNNSRVIWNLVQPRPIPWCYRRQNVQRGGPLLSLNLTSSFHQRQPTLRNFEARTVRLNKFRILGTTWFLGLEFCHDSLWEPINPESFRKTEGF